VTGSVAGDVIIGYKTNLLLGHIGSAPHVSISTGGVVAINGLTASSAVATDASKNLVSVTNTGTGNNVLAVSPALTGTPTAPTAAANDNSTKIATTAFVLGQAATVAPANNGVAAVGASLLYARQDHVHASDTTKANLASPAFTGVPTAPTAAANNNSTQLATTAYLDTKLAAANGIATLDGSGKLTSAQIPASLVGAVQYQGTWNANTNSPALASGVGTKGQYFKVSVAGATTIDTISQWNVGDTIIFDGTTWDKIDGIANEVLSVAGKTGVVTLAVADITGAAPLASPTLTGIPAAPTAAALNNSTQIATTAYTDGAVSTLSGTTTTALALKAPLASPTLTGTPAAPTAAVDTNTTQIATTAMVLGQASAVAPLPGGVAAAGASTRFARADHVHALGIQNHLAGLTLSAAGATATFGVAAGVACDSTNVSPMTLAAAITKTTGAWAVGTANGALDTGAIAASTWYHAYLIKRPDTGVVDVAVSLSATAPTTGGSIPAAYTLFRRIGSMKTDGSSQWVKFFQDGDNFIWDVPAGDFLNIVNPGTAAILRTLSVPLGITSTAIFHYRTAVTTAASAVATICTDPAQTDTAPDFNNSQQIGNTSISPFTNIRIRTNASSQIRVRLNFSDANTGFTLVTDGWVDTRGK
jgi:hypothetical protein